MDNGTLMVNGINYNKEGTLIVNGVNYSVGAYVSNEEELNNLQQEIIEGKTLIANAVTDKGIEASMEDSFETLAEKISMIVNSGSHLEYWEIPALTSNSCTINDIYYQVSGDSAIDSSRTFYKAFNGIISTENDPTYETWHSAANSNQSSHWLKLDTSKRIKLNKIIICNRYSAGNSPDPKIVTLSASDDGINWDILLDNYTLPNVGSGKTNEISIETEKLYTHFKWNFIPIGTLGGQYYLCINEIKMFGEIETN